MSLRPFVIGASLLAHGALVYALGEIRVDEAQASTSIEVVDTKKEKPKPPPVEVDTPPEEKTQRAQNPRPAAAPPPDAPTPSSAPLSDLPDFGLDLSGGGSGDGGFAIAQGTGPINPGPKAAPVQKTLAPVVAPPVADTCDEPPAKPKLVSAPQPAYTDAARAAGVEGKVRLQLIVDENGHVVDAKIVSGLGHGLDELALAAAKAVTFEGAVRCGKPSRSTVNFAFRFSAS